MNKKVLLILIFMFLLSSIAFAQELPIGLQRLKQYEQQLASSITFLLAFFAGLISMTSPCGIALLPAFFSFAFKDRKKAVLMTTAFSIGLLIAFTIFGLIAGFLGDFFNSYKLMFAVVSGYALIFFGILLFFNVGFSIFNFKLDYRKEKSFFSVAMLGFFFGVGWTPCVGPILVGILVLAANAATVLNGTLMLIFYGIGIVAPLIVLAYFSDRHDWANSKILRGKQIEFKLFNRKIITHTYNLIGGILLIIIGILMVLFQGTFFFQTELPKYVPWSMSFWGYLNEKALESKIFTSTTGNILGIIIGLLVIVFVVWYLNKRRDKKMKASKLFFVLFVVGLFFIASCANKQETSQALKNLEKFKFVTIEHPNNPAPSFTLTDDKGVKSTSSDLKGKVYILQGFAPGCSSCAREIATLNKAYDKFKDKGLEIISLDVASDDISGAINTKKQFNGGDWHWTIDTDNVAIKFGIRTLESTYLVDKEGIIRYKDESITDADTLLQEIEKLV